VGLVAAVSQAAASAEVAGEDGEISKWDKGHETRGMEQGEHAVCSL